MPTAAADETPGPPVPDREEPDRRWWRSEAGRLLELSALCGFAIAHPVLDPFGGSPGTFVAVGADSGDIVTFAVLVALVPVAAVAGLGALAHPGGPRARAATHLALLGLLGGAAAVQVTRTLGAPGTLRAADGILVGIGLPLARARFATVRSWLRFAGPAPLLFVAVFLLASPTAALVGPGRAGTPGGATTGDASPSLLLVVLDELPTLSLLDGEGGIDRDAFPNLARLADQSTWYRDATTVAPTTNTAVPALLTGRMPEGAGTATVHAEHPDNLFALLGDSHDLHVREWVTDLCPPGRCPDEPVELTDDALALLAEPVETPRGPLDALVRAAANLWWDRVRPLTPTGEVDLDVTGTTSPSDLARPGLEFLSGLGPTDADRPAFDFLHAPVPHQPWYLLPSGRSYDGPHPAVGSEFLGWGEGPGAAELAAIARVRHLLQAQWTDRLLGAVFDRLEELGRWDDTLVVVTADHGISFEPGTSLRRIHEDNEVEIAWVPLLVKEPGQRDGRVEDGNVVLTDVFPTVLELLDVEADVTTDGRSFADGPARVPGDKPFLRTSQPDGPSEVLDPLRVAGLEVLRAAPGAVGAGVEGTLDGADPLRTWRVGRLGSTLGRDVDDLGTCPGPAAGSVTLETPARWPGPTAGSSLPLWLDGTVRTFADGTEAGDDAAARDVVAAVHGHVAAWGPVHRAGRVVMLLAEPVVGADPGPIELYEVVERDTCRLAPLALG